jgi:hypothetical protein
MLNSRFIDSVSDSITFLPQSHDLFTVLLYLKMVDSCTLIALRPQVLNTFHSIFLFEQDFHPIVKIVSWKFHIYIYIIREMMKSFQFVLVIMSMCNTQFPQLLSNLSYLNQHPLLILQLSMRQYYTK